MNNNTKNNKKWYPLYTRPKHEKTAYANIISNGYEAYLPLIKETRKWSDRKRIVDVPLIKSYVFAFLNQHQLYEVTQFHGVSRYIKFNNGPAFVRDEEIESLKKMIDSEVQIEVSDNIIAPGKRIKMLAGPMAGYEGEIIEEKGKNKLLVRLDSIGKSLKIVIDKESFKLNN
jgi:transcriptional antiterminator RfaH